MDLPDTFRSVGDVLTGLARVERSFIERKDRRGVFASAYVASASALDARLAQHRFLDHERVERYAIAFANRYLLALASHRTRGEDGRLAASWRLSFEAPKAGERTVLRDLLLGMNAHINHDLPHAILDAGLDLECDECQEDHARMNGVLRGATPSVRRRVVAFHRPRLRIPNALFGRLLHRSVGEAIRRTRSEAWIWAGVLRRAGTPRETRIVEKSIDDRAVAIGRRLLSIGDSPFRQIRALCDDSSPASSAAVT